MARIDRQSAFSGTKEVAQPLRFDEARLADYLAAKVPDFRGPLAVRQFKGGQSNPTYFLETPAALLRAAPQAAGQAPAVGARGRPRIPRHLGAPPAGLSGAGARRLLRRPGGRRHRVLRHGLRRRPHLLGAASAGLAIRPERAAIYDAANATIARLHGFDPAAIGLADFGRGENYVARQVERWSKQYRTSQTDDIADMERLIEWLPRHLPPAGPVRLVHGDFRLDNTIIAADAPKILAVLDWELSTLGDPLADFTYHLMKWHMPETDTGASTGSLLGHDLAALGIPAMSDYVDAYVARTGLDPRPYLPVYLAYNFFRIAAIYQGIVGRVRDGTATSEHAPAKAAMVRPLAATAWAFACEAR